MGILRIQPVKFFVTTGEQTSCAVLISGGAPKQTIQIRLTQTAGAHPLYDATDKVELDDHGDGVAVFDVALHDRGPATVSLHAQSPDAQPALAADDVAIRVLP